MALDPASDLRPARPGDSTAQPWQDNARSQSMQRLQIGLSGLVAMVLLMGLANLIINNAQRNEARVVPEAAPTVSTKTPIVPYSDPLAEAGVVPDMPAEVEASRNVASDEARGGAEPQVP